MIQFGFEDERENLSKNIAIFPTHLFTHSIFSNMQYTKYKIYVKVAPNLLENNAVCSEACGVYFLKFVGKRKKTVQEAQ